ncbi:hypothetical protein [Treponema sp.]|uniref:hypothetical protein n=1 Tax=Treponema sp. TaxID=166 RepID=UPI00388D290C
MIKSSILKKVSLFLAGVSLFFVSCDTNTGLGEEVDLEAPVISVRSLVSDGSDAVTNFAGGVYCHKSVSFTGTATDNNQVTRVYTQIKRSSDSSFSDFKTAVISGTTWNLDFNFDEEGTVILNFIASDASGNFGTRSSKTVILFVDENAPVGTSWYIDRKINGIQYSLHELDYLKSLDLNESANIDAAQNMAFAISANFNDTMGIDVVSISIYDENENQVCEIQKADDSAVYAPVFEITNALLTQANSSLATGKHYLQVRYSASDVVTVPSANTVTDAVIDAGWFIWWPESDEPRYELQEDIEENAGNKTITVYVNSSFPVTVFDDDELESAEVTFTYTDENSASQTDTKNASVNSGEREKTMVITTPSTPQTAELKVKAKGNKGTTDGGLSVSETITVNVVDATSPMLLITSPKNNSVPPVTMSSDNTSAKVTISGTSLDVSGCKYLEFVWVPDSIASTTAEKSTVAKEFLETLTTDSAHDSYKPSSGSAKRTEITGVGVLWSVSLSSSSFSGGFNTQTFSFDIDLFTDFSSSGDAFTNENKTSGDKFFVARLVRSGSTGTFAEYKLAGDSSNPTISPVTPGGDMAIVSSEEELVLEFKGVKTSGMAMDTSAYEIRRVDAGANDGKFGNYDSGKGYATVSGNYDAAAGTYKATAISKDILHAWKESGTKPTFQFFAKDLLGNDGKDQYTIVISSLPVLKSVTSPSSTMLKKGDELLINAVFDNTVSVSDTSGLYVKLTGFSDSTVRQAKYKSGSGSTTLVFSYTIADGDSSEKVQVKNDGSPIEGLSETIATQTDGNGDSVVNESNLLQTKKTITVDGIVPTASILIESSLDSSESDYTKNGTVYLNSGKTLTVTLTTSETVLIQGSPSFEFKIGTETVSLPFTGSTANKVTFSKKIAETDAEGVLTYIPASCIADSDTIVDKAGNKISLSGAAAITSKYAVDITAPAAPSFTIKDSSGNTVDGSGRYANYVKFYVNSGDDATVKTTQYSRDAGNIWLPSDGTSLTEGSSGEVTIDTSCSLTARRIDYAGNISDYPSVIDLKINSTFPAYSIECTNPDGNYKAGSKLVFKVSFDDKVNYSSTSLYSESALTAGTCAYIQLSALNSGESCGNGANSGRAYLSDKNGNALTAASSSSTDTVYFTYEAQDPDQFTLKVAASDVKLNGFTDSYGISQGNKYLDEDYERESLVCDGVAPKVVSMTPGGTKTTASDGNVYSQGNVITLKFSEEIQKSSGKITLRQVAGWAIPPVLSGDDFSTVINAIPSSYTDSISAKTGKYILCMDELEDMEDVEKGIHYANDNYHGAGQYVGPYKKSSQGLTTSGANFVPDTSTKYVLDFDYGIWETTTTHYIGQTFQSGYASTNNTSSTNRLKVLSGSELSETRTVNQLRNAFEAAGYHERVLDVTSSAVVIDTDNKTVTITFPAGLCDISDELPYGRKWELVIEKEAFMDSTGNYFGAEANGNKAEADAVQKSGVQYTVGSSVETDYSQYAGSWDRAQSSTTSPVVLICNGENEYFFSDKVATPVVRVDRYSYGLGIYQSDANGTEGNQITSDAVKPTGYARVRIDCETDGATVKYTKDVSHTTTPKTTGTADQIDTSNGTCSSYITTTSLPSSLSSTTAGINYTKDTYFAVGNGKYNQGFKGFVIATATKTGFTNSDSGYEGVFQTVARIYNHTQGNGWRSTATLDKGDGYRDFSIRGTTGWGGEPVISPFPLRDSRNGSPYLRRCFHEYAVDSNSLDYYWVSYEVLVGSSVSGYSYGNTGGTYWGYNWSKNWGYIEPGETSYITGMQCWESY